MLTETLFTDWLQRYKFAWETRDPEAAKAIFTTDATYRETPFEETMTGREAIGTYWHVEVRDSQANVAFTSAVLAVVGNVGFARWQSEFDWLPDGKRLELDGIFRCRFRFGGAEDGLCCALEEWWHQREIEVEP